MISSYVTSIRWTEQANLEVAVLSAVGEDRVGGLRGGGGGGTGVKKCRQFLKKVYSLLSLYFLILSPNATITITRPFL